MKSVLYRRVLLYPVLVLVCSCSVLCKEEIDLRHDAYEKDERHLVFQYAFADMDGLGDHELVLIETSPKSFYDSIITINQIQEDSRRRILSELPIQTLQFKLLVGDIDGDGKDEVLLHRSAYLWDVESGETARVIEFENGQYQETRTRSLNGERGALVDFNNDGKQEILIVAFTEFPEKVEMLYPTEMRLYTYDHSEFKLLTKYDMGDTTIQCIAIGDADSDGEAEIVTQEATYDGELVHQISVYDVDNSGEITHLFSKNRALTFSGGHPTRARAMRVFTDDDSNTYVSAYKMRPPIVRPRGVTLKVRPDDMLLRVEMDNEIVDLVSVRGDLDLRSLALSMRFPSNGTLFAEVVNREPKLDLYEYSELGQVVQLSDQR